MFPATITINTVEELQIVLAALHPTTAAPKSAAASDASGKVTARQSAAPTKTDAEPTHAAASAADKSPASTAADTKKQKAESAPATAQSAASAAAATTGSSTPVTFEQARALVLKLAPTHREAIKQLNTKHGIAKLGALLADENDFNSVTDQAKLEAVYADLQALGA